MEEASNLLRKRSMMLTNIRNERYDSIVETLTLFNGSITIGEILREPLCYINYLVDAKLRLLDRQEKESTKNPTKNVSNTVGFETAVSNLRKSKITVPHPDPPAAAGTEEGKTPNA